MTFSIPNLETQRLILRAPKDKDLKAQAAFFASERSHFVGGPKPLGGAWQFLTLMLGHWQMRGFGMWVVQDKTSNAAVGMVGHYYPVGWPEREIGWHIWNAKTEGKGIAYEAAIAARDFAYRVLGWKTQVSYIAPDNTRSIALAERMGAKIDRSAALPETGEETPLAAYRHPSPEALS